MENLTLTAIPGIRVGHFTETRRPTGCTVVLFDVPAVAGVDVRGGAPGTRETDALAPLNLVDQTHAIVLAGGSAFGLDAATGVVRYLRERDIGFDVGVARIPIVPAAILFDLHTGDPTIYPDADAGYRACLAATDAPVTEGAVGAGAGATVGKLLGIERASRGGSGSFAFKLPSGVQVAALVIVNAVGDIRHPQTQAILAGARQADGSFADLAARIRAGDIARFAPLPPASHTTIGLVAVNVPLTKPELTKVAHMAHDGLARTISPVHTLFDGDTLFAVSVPDPALAGATDTSCLGALAADAVAEAVARGVMSATFPA
ncbi:MAG: P1 family peptidase [Chloracidobacterium sp.]|uniref:P1 family peptidase n=1 Tax=Chloracidobacterium validum TaxID=2821543 RepID=A0ABX8B565_9BACT|nr:P1 family peptidase [Chloracidobacterium validum]QUW02108.1 P1 family peptidase [Chloracidobacterium validum]